ncbi:MAG: hypothetical protein ABIP03_01590 [Aquihabitans sp.]
MANTLTRSPSAAYAPSNVEDNLRTNPVYQAFWLLRIGFTVAPIAFGLDKFFHVLVNWDLYLAPVIVRQLPWTAHQVMYAVGAMEVIAGLVVALRPRFGGYLVAVWLAAIIADLLVVPGYYDIALRDFGLLLGALTLARLATVFPAWPATFKTPR